MTTRIEQMKDAIDRGATGEKAPGFDPAAAPLGADEEAAATPLREDRIKMALSSETKSAQPVLEHKRVEHLRRIARMWIAVGIVILLTVAAVVTAIKFAQ